MRLYIPRCSQDYAQIYITNLILSGQAVKCQVKAVTLCSKYCDTGT